VLIAKNKAQTEEEFQIYISDKFWLVDLVTTSNVR